MALPTKVNRLTNDPFTDMQREFDTLMGRFMGAPQRADGRRSAPYAVEVREDNDHLYFEFELPGYRKDEIDITLEDNTLTVTAEHKEENNDQKKGDVLFSERRHTFFTRSFQLPPTVDPNNVDAGLSDGVLNLTLKKREETKPRKVQVK